MLKHCCCGRGNYSEAASLKAAQSLEDMLGAGFGALSCIPCYRTGRLEARSVGVKEAQQKRSSGSPGVKAQKGDSVPRWTPGKGLYRTVFP